MKKEMIVGHEEQFHLLVKSIKDYAIVMLDTKGYVVSWNQGIYAIQGYTADEIIGKHFSIFYTHEEQALGIPEHNLDMTIKFGHYSYESWLVRKDRTLFWANTAFTALYNDDAQLIGFSKVTRDRTESRLYEKQLRESEEKFQKAFQGSAAAISITRLSDSCYLDVNESFVQMTGYSKEELIGHSSSELGIVRSIQKREEILEQIRLHGSAKDFEMTIRNKSGSIIEILSSVDTIILGGEKFAINIIYDITERKKEEAHLQSLNKELEAFTYSVSHDLRAPLRAINLYSQLLTEDFSKLLGKEGSHFIDTIRQNTAKMVSLIDALLAFSQLGHQNIRKRQIDLDKLTKDVIDHINIQLPHKAEIRLGQLHTVEADYDLLYQVIFNLISNAVKYSSRKENPLVEIHSEKSTEAVTFIVKDNGAGFDMKFADKLFGVFKRLHLDSEFEGTGAGLAIVHRIIDKHGGQVWAEGKKDKGAAFYFKLPIY